MPDASGKPRVWLRFGPVCAVAGSVVHATDIPRRKTRRTTWDTACGARGRVLVHNTTDGDLMSLAWPPPVKDARLWGYERCRECMQVRPGRVQHPLYAPETGAPDA